MTDAPKLKDYFTPAAVREIGDRLAAHHRPFDVDAFVSLVLSPADSEPFDQLEFTARSRRIADVIDRQTSLDPPELFDLLVRSLPPELDGSEGVLNDGFSLWPYGDVIAAHGAGHPEEGLAACLELTTRFTSEFAIRPILAAHPQTLATVGGWTDHHNEHVRRLVSEGTRPRLPWARRLTLPVDEVLGILARLRADPSPYVRKSVANHLNDLAKDHPDRIIDLLAGWYREGVEETRWIVKHALRNHLKNGTPAALSIFGYLPPKVSVEDLCVSPKQPSIGETVEATFSLVSTDLANDQKLMVDLVMGYVKAGGSTSPKVFKYRELNLTQGGETCAKSFAMVPRSTRRLYPGSHSLTVRVNGEDLATTTFELTES